VCIGSHGNDLLINYREITIGLIFGFQRLTFDRGFVNVVYRIMEKDGEQVKQEDNNKKQKRLRISLKRS